MRAASGNIEIAPDMIEAAVRGIRDRFVAGSNFNSRIKDAALGYTAGGAARGLSRWRRALRRRRR